MKLPELLSPAGNADCALAAFDAGADAVYAGLSKFNARERGDNFTEERLCAVVDHAHKNGKKVYLTLNTLIKECELSELLEMLAAVNDIAPDGVLVQDKNGVQFKIPADNVILSTGYKSAPLFPKASNVYHVGDCSKVGNLRSVIWQAWDVCMKI